MKLKVGAIVPRLLLANVQENRKEIVRLLKKAEEQNIELTATPELSLTGVTCGDLFFQPMLLEECEKELQLLLEETKYMRLTYSVGMPLKIEENIYDVAIVIKKGNVLGIVSKANLSYLEKRWFSECKETKKIDFLGKQVEFGKNINFPNFDVQIGEKVSISKMPIVLQMSADYELAGAEMLRKEKIREGSYQNQNTYIYASSGIGESVTDGVFSGHSMIVEKGKIVAENKTLDWESNSIFAEIDTECVVEENIKINHKEIDETYPFLTGEEEKILKIQATALARRLEHTHIQKTVIGLSGGLDSTLAFLVIVEAYKILKIENSNILCFTMPGFGTTTRTYQNACTLAKIYGATLKEIDIKPICEKEREAIGLEKTDRSIAFENMQARQRTAILMNVANKENGIVIGTGNMSELALGWCTYNGDHMSMYAVNAGIPKTVVRSMVKKIAEKQVGEQKNVLGDILQTPISPELLPPTKENTIAQQTEKIIGNYTLHDFFLYHFIGERKTPIQIYEKAIVVFKGIFEESTIKDTLNIFMKRFFSQQFKRNCMPEGPKAVNISLSPRGGYILPGDKGDVSFCPK